MVDINLDSQLEKTLVELSEESDNADHFLTQYKQSKRHLENEVYDWVQSECNWFTDHGDQHISAVMHQASRLLENELRNFHDEDLTELDVYLLLTTTLWHDVGMIMDRTTHEEISTEVSDRFVEMAFPTGSIKAAADDIIKAHRKKDGLDIPQKSADFNYNNEVYKVYPKALAGILRFADEISETQERVSGDSWIQSIVPSDSEIYWRYAQTIQGCYPHLNGKSVNINIEMEYDRAIKKYPCPDSFESRSDDDGEICLIEYVVCRLEKLVNELSYCERYFNRYVEIRDVELDMTIRDDSNNILKDIDETISASGLKTKGNYPNVEIYDRFFEEYTVCKPDQLLGIDQLESDDVELPHQGDQQ